MKKGLIESKTIVIILIVIILFVMITLFVKFGLAGKGILTNLFRGR